MMTRSVLSHAAFLVLLTRCLGCNSEPDTSFSIPSPTNGQAPPEEEILVADRNNPFTPTSSSIQGLWKMKSGRVNGTKFPPSLVNTTTLRLDGENYEVESGGKPDKGTCIQDLTTSPYRMKISSVEGANAGKTILAIFEMPNEATLRVCYDLTGSDFPTAYESTSENGYFAVVYSRQP